MIAHYFRSSGLFWVTNEYSAAINPDQAKNRGIKIWKNKRKINKTDRFCAGNMSCGCNTQCQSTHNFAYISEQIHHRWRPDVIYFKHDRWIDIKICNSIVSIIYAEYSPSVRRCSSGTALGALWWRCRGHEVHQEGHLHWEAEEVPRCHMPMSLVVVSHEGPPRRTLRARPRRALAATPIK